MAKSLLYQASAPHAIPPGCGLCERQEIPVTIRKNGRLYRFVLRDKIVVMGTEEAMRRVHERVVGKQPQRARMLVTIVGGGDVGLRLAQRLDRQRNVELRVIESDPARGELLAAQLKRALVLKGDGKSPNTLEKYRESVGV